MRNNVTLYVDYCACARFYFYSALFPDLWISCFQKSRMEFRQNGMSLLGFRIYGHRPQPYSANLLPAIPTRNSAGGAVACMLTCAMRYSTLYYKIATVRGVRIAEKRRMASLAFVFGLAFCVTQVLDSRQLAQGQGAHTGTVYTYVHMYQIRGQAG